MDRKLYVHQEGQKAVCIYANHEFFEQSAYPIEKAIDTMGAGDSLITTFMVGYLDRKKKGMHDDVAIKESIKEAAKFAAKVCQMEGAFGHGKEVQIDALKTK